MPMPWYQSSACCKLAPEDCEKVSATKAALIAISVLSVTEKLHGNHTKHRVVACCCMCDWDRTRPSDQADCSVCSLRGCDLHKHVNWKVMLQHRVSDLDQGIHHCTCAWPFKLPTPRILCMRASHSSILKTECTYKAEATASMACISRASCKTARQADYHNAKPKCVPLFRGHDQIKNG